MRFIIVALALMAMFSTASASCAEGYFDCGNGNCDWNRDCGCDAICDKNDGHTHISNWKGSCCVDATRSNEKPECTAAKATEACLCGVKGLLTCKKGLYCHGFDSAYRSDCKKHPERSPTPAKPDCTVEKATESCMCGDKVTCPKGQFCHGLDNPYYKQCKNVKEEVEGDWFMLRQKTGAPVRCSATEPNMIECASNNNKNCFWGRFPKQEPYTLMTKVNAKKPYAIKCPGWKPDDGSDACAELGCYDHPWGSTCQQLSNYYGINHGRTSGCAPKSAQTWWKNTKCNTRPQTSTNPGCCVSGPKRLRSACMCSGAHCDDGSYCYKGQCTKKPAYPDCGNSETSKVKEYCVCGVKKTTCGTDHYCYDNKCTTKPKPQSPVEGDWFMLRHKTGTPVRCSAKGPNMIECASNNNKNCFWKKFKKQEPYTLMKNVNAKKPYAIKCPGWKPDDGSDACAELSCYDNEHEHTSLPTKRPTSPQAVRSVHHNRAEAEVGGAVCRCDTQQHNVGEKLCENQIHKQVVRAHFWNYNCVPLPNNGVCKRPTTKTVVGYEVISSKWSVCQVQESCSHMRAGVYQSNIGYIGHDIQGVQDFTGKYCIFSVINGGLRKNAVVSIDGCSPAANKVGWTYPQSKHWKDISTWTPYPGFYSTRKLRGCTTEEWVADSESKESEESIAGSKFYLEGGLNIMMFIVFILVSAFLGFYIGRQKSGNNNKYNLLVGDKEIGMVSYQTQQE